MTHPLTDWAIRSLYHPVVSAFRLDEVVELGHVHMIGHCASINPIFNSGEWHVQVAGKLPDAQSLVSQPEFQVQHGQILLQYGGRGRRRSGIIDPTLKSRGDDYVLDT